MFFKSQLLKAGSLVLFALLTTAPAQKQDTLALLGLFGGNLDTVLSQQLFRSIEKHLGREQTTVTLSLSRTTLESLAASYNGGDSLDWGGLRRANQELGRLQGALAVFFTRHPGRYRIDLRVFRPSGPAGRLTLWYLPEFSREPERLARTLTTELLMLLRFQEREEPANGLECFLTGAKSILNYRILRSDSLRSVPLGTEIWTTENAGIQKLRTGETSYLLFPNSIYNHAAKGVLGLTQGKLAVMSGQDTVHFHTSSLRGRGRIGLALLYHWEAGSEVALFVGHAHVKPLLSAREEVVMTAPASFSTRGYDLRYRRLASDEAAIHLEGLLEMIPDSLRDSLAQQTGKEILAESDTLDMMRQAVGDSMDYFAAEGLQSLGIPMEALFFEGEAWHLKGRSWNPTGHETTCYLCSPGHIGP